MANSSRKGRAPKKRHYRNERELEEANKRAFLQAAWEQRACAVSGDARDRDDQGYKNWEAHHVVEKRWLKANFMFLWDPRNVLRLTPDAHRRHTNRMEPVPLSRLTDANIEYAFEIMEHRAYEYLTRMYTGVDERVEQAGREAEEKRLAQMETRGG